jgi:hypothetical protein
MEPDVYDLCLKKKAPSSSTGSSGFLLFKFEFASSILVLTGMFNLHMKVVRDAESAKLGLKLQGKTNNSKDKR